MTRPLASPFLLIALLLGAQAASADPGPAPSQVVEAMVTDVLAVLGDAKLSTAERRARIEAIAYARFDMPTMTKLVLARNWKRLDDAQRDAFVSEFKQYLANYYGRRIDDYKQERVEILGERKEPRGDVTVQSRIVGGEYDDALVDYRLRQAKNGQWYVIDVVVEGISVLSNYRDQFREVMSRGGPERLLEQLREKNASGDFGDEGSS